MGITSTTNGANGGASSPVVFISYAHEDENWKDELLPHLTALQLDQQIDVWHDGLIDTGGKWRDHIEEALERSSARLVRG